MNESYWLCDCIHNIFIPFKEKVKIRKIEKKSRKVYKNMNKNHKLNILIALLKGNEMSLLTKHHTEDQFVLDAIYWRLG